ncbi:hypothetical protein [Collinsella tanakaei]|uniref:hypothetical protein n=1 Tax=Collinsella tanakaei TaxID=626935 RepID=UPI001958399F|nr:hypothetical protein [Collinsella tanakaei]MBM6868162.1 hypothetical protein [Collinsella tanakaei]
MEELGGFFLLAVMQNAVLLQDDGLRPDSLAGKTNVSEGMVGAAPFDCPAE